MTQQDLAFLAHNELVTNILPFWKAHSRDLSTGGFYGTIFQDSTVDAVVPRSIVMTARHLWTFSAASRILEDPELLEMADYAYASIVARFIDPMHGGVFWSVNQDGSPAVTKKQVYGQAFTIYGFSEYARALFAVRNDSEKAKEMLSHAVSLFLLLEEHARDTKRGGYGEALARDWSKTKDLKLSEKDIDCEKSMNTNLHVMEAFTCLHQSLSLVSPEETSLISRVTEALSSLVLVTAKHIVGSDGHLDLYFTSDWKQIGDPISFGHDIEASWLMWEAIEELGVKSFTENGIREDLKKSVIRIAEIALQEGWDSKTGGFENEIHNGKRDTSRIWWCQAEAVVGFFNAWQMTQDQKYLDAVYATWQWIEAKQVDKENGDWFWNVNSDGFPDLREVKGGNWKTGYHNARSCMEIIQRIKASRNQELQGEKTNDI